MRTIEISETVWQAIADKGKFGETEDDVLRRVFRLPILNEESHSKTISNNAHVRTHQSSSKKRRSIATQRMSSYIDNDKLHVSFAGGKSLSWSLPVSSDKAGIRSVREKAVSFARDHDATIGQQNAVKKTLTDNGYHLTK